MHIDALNYFIYVVEEKSISKAAKRAHMSQSALSQQIQKLEEHFGYPLLLRSNRGVSMTNMGEVVLKYASNITKSYDRMVEELDFMAHSSNKIVISGTVSLAAYSLPCVIYRIKKKYSEYTYELKAESMDQIISDIHNDVVDFGFIDQEPDEKEDLFSYRMGKERIVLIAPYNYQIPDHLSVGQLMDMEMIMCTINQRTCELLDKALQKVDLSLGDLKVIFNADSVSAVKSSVTNGYGMAFVPYESVKHELYEKTVKTIDVQDVDLDYDIYLVSKPKSKLSKAAKESVEYLIEVGRKSFC